MSYRWIAQNKQWNHLSFFALSHFGCNLSFYTWTDTQTTQSHYLQPIHWQCARFSLHKSENAGIHLSISVRLSPTKCLKPIGKMIWAFFPFLLIFTSINSWKQHSMLIIAFSLTIPFFVNSLILLLLFETHHRKKQCVQTKRIFEIALFAHNIEFFYFTCRRKWIKQSETRMRFHGIFTLLSTCIRSNVCNFQCIGICVCLCACLCANAIVWNFSFYIFDFAFTEKLFVFLFHRISPHAH